MRKIKSKKIVYRRIKPKNIKPKKIEHKELTSIEQKELFNKICDDIIQYTNEYRAGFNERALLYGENRFPYDLTDLGDFIGKAIGINTCKDEKDLNIWAYDKESFVAGFYHGYSIMDGTH